MSTTGAALAPCFMVYPVPSIGDESLLQTIFRHKVSRSIFVGYGPRRVAIVELNDADLIRDVCAALEKKTAQAPVSAEITATALGLGEETGRSRKGKQAASAALVNDWLDTLMPSANPAPGEEGQVTLADLFAAPPVEETGKKPPTKSASAKGVLFDLSASGSVDYITALHWRGRPVHVTVSAITVEEFYQCGGTVPTHAAAKKRIRDGEPEEEASAPRSRKRAEGRSSAGDRADVASPVTGGSETAKTSGSAAAVFPKNCCQKCGSPDHFTRHCDGSGPGASAATAKETTTPEDATGSTEQKPKRAEAVAPPRTPAPVFPKNCCQKCGSPDHFTRHCDGSGASPTVTPAAPVAPPVVPQKPAAAAVVRTSKDQCKFCGSADHLSRHCPSK